MCMNARSEPVAQTGVLQGQSDFGEAFHTHYPRICREIRRAESGRLSWATIDVFEDVFPGGIYMFGNERLILNPGSVGQPRDGDPRASYAILDTAARSFTVRRVAYDIQAAQSRTRSWLKRASAELLNGHGGLAERLQRGI